MELDQLYISGRLSLLPGYVLRPVMRKDLEIVYDIWCDWKWFRADCCELLELWDNWFGFVGVFTLWIEFGDLY